MTRVPEHDTPDVPAQVRTARPSRFRRLREIRERARQRPALDLTWRVVMFMIGTAMIGAGIAGLILPVLPGWALIFVGLGLLATEFAWAERVLDRVRARFAAAADVALDPRKRRRNVLIMLLVITAFMAVSAWYVVTFGFTWPWATGD